MHISDEFRADALAFAVLKEKTLRHYWRLMRGLDPMTDDEFWPLMDDLRELVADRLKQHGKMEAVKSAAVEFFRRSVVDGFDLEYETALRFLVTYKNLKSRVGRALSPLFDYHGDWFGDLCDSWPLAGRAVTEQALATRPGNRLGFLNEKEVTRAAANLPEPFRAVVGTELYVESSLEDAGLEYLWSWMGKKVFTEAENELIHAV